MIKVTMEYQVKGSFESTRTWAEYMYLVNKAILDQTDYPVRKLSYKVELQEGQDFDILDKKTK